MRTDAMNEKMRRFTDAGKYEQDNHIDFLPSEHIYLYDEERQLLPVSRLVAYFFEPFDAYKQALLQWERKGIPVETSLEKWNKIGARASEVGTFVHEQTENYFQNGEFLDEYTFHYNDQSERISVAAERKQFLDFVAEHQIKPYRQEWPVFDLDLNLAGTIDLVCKNQDGTFTIYDWKRSQKVVDANGCAITEGFRGKMSCNGIEIPDTAFYHYCIQQNLYRYMLEKNYGVVVSSLNLVVLSAEYDTYHKVEVPFIEDVLNQIVTICHQRDLGHHLLKS